MSENMTENTNRKVNENIIKDALKLAALVLYCAAVFVIADGGFGGFWVGIGLFAAATYILYYSGGNREEKPDC
ncbi:MAG: hypothetical protein II893_05865 [Methanomicrobium sp.]|nr:hypothetical protein [Methanomicrobium sp.]